ncbi:MAG: secondary thiamine-phosphate synthase enzyme YjbQ [Anaerolineae bacterium]|nr:secondary thiamine-phosphate synthase enzyme YjbQ [Anaerolineae bacterium]MDW8097920.1 secondary thiamine-phosphate synthase enzyme YjbQ [Anaerolineae bacterium]
METIWVTTRGHEELLDITGQVQEAVSRSGVTEGVCCLFVPHTTAGITLNENWDPDVRRDLLLTLSSMAPADPRHRHAEGNSPAHIKASLCGTSALVFVSAGRLQLGSWQGIYLAEFDGPRQRQVWVKVIRG